MQRKRLAPLALAFSLLAGCGATQGYFRPDLAFPSASSPQPRTRVDGGMAMRDEFEPESDPSNESDRKGRSRKASVPDSVMIRDQDFGNYHDSPVPTS